MSPRVLARWGVAVGASGLLGCFSDRPGAGPSPPASGGAQIAVADFAFVPATLSVETGDTVTWTWTSTGDIPHSVRSLGSPIFRNSIIQTGDGKTYEATFHSAGTYQYDCAIHGDLMTGRVVVQ